MSSPTDKKTVVVSTGDPAGCAPELIPPLLEHDPPSIRLEFHGPDELREWLEERVGAPFEGRHTWRTVGSLPGDRILGGQPDETTGTVAYESLASVMDAVDEGRADGILTLPLSKEAVHRAGHTRFRGHTDTFEDHWDRRSVMTFLGDDLDVALLTRHCPLAEVPGRLTEELITDQVVTADRFYQSRLSGEPRFAILGLNPHAGEQGLMGDEEQTVIEPAMETLSDRGIEVEGPFAADSYFPTRSDDHDCVFACYHDQGLIPFKMNNFYTGVHATLGLPVPRVSPDHGVAAELAGTGQIDTRSTVNSLRALTEWLNESNSETGMDS
jgi:4-hydroxythreonine-4-phosphate dehydrogenase